MSMAKDVKLLTQPSFSVYDFVWSECWIDVENLEGYSIGWVVRILKTKEVSLLWHKGKNIWVQSVGEEVLFKKKT